MTLFWASPQAAGCFLVVAAHRHIRISTHPPREGWDKTIRIEFTMDFISIHPPREGWDSKDAQNEPSSYEPLRQKTHPKRRFW